MRYNKFISFHISVQKKKEQTFYKMRLAVPFLWPAQTLAKLVWLCLFSMLSWR